MKWLFALGIVVVSFSGSLWLMDFLFPLCPQGKVFPLKGPFSKFSIGFAYVAGPSFLNDFADAASTPNRSSYAVCENSSLLGPAHSPHADIDTKGQGRFSHWNGMGFVFSATDNSDPNTNGRKYIAVLPR